MIDLHTHILPNIDDGARCREEAIEMTESLYNQNISMAVCTPHFNPMQIALKEFIKKRTTAMNLMKGSKVKLIPGSETMLHTYLFHYSDLDELCIGNTRYLLIELPYGEKVDRKVYEIIERLIRFYNVNPIIAHIERYGATNKNIERLRDMGCVIQLNTTSIIDKESRKKALRYMKYGYIDVLGSDCHNMSNRPPVVTPAFDLVVNKINEKCCSNLKYNAECIINGIEIRKKSLFIIK